MLPTSPRSPLRFDQGGRLIFELGSEINEQLTSSRTVSTNLHPARQLDIGVEDDWSELRYDIRESSSDGPKRFAGVIMRKITFPHASLSRLIPLSEPDSLLSARLSGSRLPQPLSPK